tara:strand:- start:286 stop:1284 length:999 start_codon:yes stop_codon:yes gene_type:complete
MSDEYKVRATLFSKEFNIGYKPAFSLRATPLSKEGTYLIESKSGKGPEEVSVGDDFQGKGKLTKNENGDLTCGEYTIPVGHSLLYGVTAEPNDEEGNKFAIFTRGSEKKHHKNIHIGEIDRESGLAWEIDTYGNLTNGPHSVKVLPELSNRRLLIRGEVTPEDKRALGIRQDNVQYATFAYNCNAEQSSYTVKGYFFRSKFKGTVGEFKESVHGELVTTARVRQDKGKFSISVRTPESAYEAQMLNDEKWDIEKQLATINDKIARKQTLGDMSDDQIKAYKGMLTTELQSINNQLDESKRSWQGTTTFFSRKEGRDFLLKGPSRSTHSEPEP